MGYRSINTNLINSNIIMLISSIVLVSCVEITTHIINTSYKVMSLCVSIYSLLAIDE